MRVLVTGAAGFIGAATAFSLLERGDEVIGIDNCNDYYDINLKDARLRHLRERFSDRFVFIKQDFGNTAALNATLADEDFDTIVHLGAQAGVRYSLENPHAYAHANLLGHLNVLEIARHRKIAHMIYASSSSVYGGNTKLPFEIGDTVNHPLSLYAATKIADELMSETYAHLYRLPLSGLRFFTVYGPWGRPDMMMWIFTVRILKGQSIPVFNQGEMYRDFTYVDDVVKGVLACLDQPPVDDGAIKAGGSTAPHRLYNIGNNRSEHLMKVIGLLEQECARKAHLEMLPMQPGDVPRTFADIDAIRADVGYDPTTPIETGVPRFVKWFKDYHAIS
ncbi:GDP-mannose 4,6-dehydratase [Croceicoccus sp. F390]|uniref:GDP-mannose 4,6-dehydratase n=1 Tax=Croceicoccus esteveae TaxID=3075597 RepID=A0ABU2ZGU8_9SPHN|nr:GDP-mannose 4,6-dehydratase [Croceicoccus sp. F390]MDT0575818.1 GDP-mannose 4,6-dehydratase [Croceicoccus sp. F390]